MAGKYSKQLTINEIKDLLTGNQNTPILDVREEEEWISGHIPGAVHMPLGSLALRINELDRGRAYAVICLSGGRSSVACEYLEAMGYEVSNVIGGMSSWDGPVAYGR